MRRVISYVQSLLLCGNLMTACDPTEPTSDLIPPPPTDPNIHIYPRLNPVGHAIAYLDHRFQLQRLELHSGLVTPVRAHAHSFDWTQDGTGFIISAGHVDQVDLNGRFVRRIIRHPYAS